jgi:hypothetical protein
MTIFQAGFNAARGFKLSISNFSDFGIPAINNPFLSMATVAHSTPNIDQTKVHALYRN